MALRELPGNRHATERLRALLASGRLGHATLFAGPEGVGKLDLALDLCAQVAPAGGTIRVHAEEGKAGISIDQIRALRQSLSLKSPDPRAVLIAPAERMTEEAMNALLKLLEEPPPGVRFVLVTAAPDALLATIRSRCHTLLFFPVAEPELRAWAAGRFGLAGEDLDLVVTLAAGSPARAERAAGELDEEKRRMDVVFAALSKGELSSAVEELVRARDTNEGREHARRAFALLAAALRDRLAGRVTPLSKRLPDGIDPLAALDALLEREILLGRNTHVGLTVENALLKVAP